MCLTLSCLGNDLQLRGAGYRTQIASNNLALLIQALFPSGKSLSCSLFPGPHPGPALIPSPSPFPPLPFLGHPFTLRTLGSSLPPSPPSHPHLPCPAGYDSCSHYSKSWHYAVESQLRTLCLVRRLSSPFHPAGLLLPKYLSPEHQPQQAARSHQSAIHLFLCTPHLRRHSFHGICNHG